MQKTPMQKHEGEEGKNLLKRCEIGADMRDGVAGRNQPIGKDKTIHFISHGHLEEKHRHVDTDEKCVDHRKISGRVDVS
jgi:hypothetical protein